MILKRTLVAMLVLAPAAQAEPLNYDYVYLSSSETDTDAGGESRGEAAGGFLSFAETLHVFASIDDAGAYGASEPVPGWDYDIRTLRAGIGGHWRIGERAMLAPGIALLRSRLTIDAPAWTQPRKSTDTGYSAQLDFRYAFTNWFEATAGVRHTRVFDASANEVATGVLFHPTDWLALGAIHHDGDERTGLEFTLRWYY